MFDVGGFFEGFRIFGGAPMGVFTFVVLLALISGIGSWLKTRAVQETIQEAIRAGTPLTPEVVRELTGGGEAGSGGLGLGGLVTLAVAVALVAFGFALSQAEGDPDVLIVFLGIAAFPGLVGIALLIAARVARQRRDDA